MFLEAMDKKLKGHEHYANRQLNPADKALAFGVDFKISHYAGNVTYAVTGFMDKNRDTLFQDFKRLLHNRWGHHWNDCFGRQILRWRGGVGWLTGV